MNTSLDINDEKKIFKKKADFYGKCKVYNQDVLVGGWDVETKGLGGKLLSIQWACMGQVYFDASEFMIDNFMSFILKHPKPFVWYAHFSQYDWRYIMDWLHENELDIEIGMRTANDIYQITIRWQGKKVIMRDSWALFSSPLEKLAKAFCPEIPKLEIDIENYDPTNPEHIEYAKRDVLILVTALPRLFTMLRDHFGVEAGATAAGTSMKGWQNSLRYDEIYNASRFGDRELFVRQAYYGGLVFLTTTNVQKDAITLDINSSYPDIMCTKGVPVGKVIKTHEYKPGKMGVYRCKVKAPDNLRIPIIPARDKKGNMRWYSGTFETVCTNVELIFAAKHGYEILEIYEGIVWEGVAFPFTDHIDKCKTIRKQFKGGPEELLAKLMQNSLYGKFGSRRERRRLFSSHYLTDEQKLHMTPFDDHGKWWVLVELDEEMRTLPEWAVFITAHARIKLLTAAYGVGVENVYYGDTDSLTMRRGCEKNIDIGDEYGQWKIEKTWKQFRAIAPKIYTGVLENGTFLGAAKGLPRKNLGDKQWKELLENGATSAQAMSLDSLRVTLKKGVKPAISLTRKSGNVNNSQNFSVDKKGDVYVKIAA